MPAILGGVGAALAFATATLCSSRSSRLIGPGPALEWAIAAVLATVAGEALSAGVVLTLTVITVGVVLSATARDAPDEAAPARDPRATTLLAIAAAALFGERLARVQIVGVAAIVSGVAVLSAIQA